MKPPDPDQKALSIADVCRELNVQKDCVYGLIEAGLLTSYFLNPTAKRRVRRVDRADLDQYKRNVKAASDPLPKRRHRRKPTGVTQYV